MGRTAPGRGTISADTRAHLQHDPDGDRGGGRVGAARSKIAQPANSEIPSYVRWPAGGEYQSVLIIIVGGAHHHHHHQG